MLCSPPSSLTVSRKYCVDPPSLWCDLLLILTRRHRPNVKRREGVRNESDGGMIGSQNRKSRGR
jgi:hypothetical protein